MSAADTTATRGRVLVTGAAGFMGRHLTSHLRNLGYAVTALDLVPGDGYAPGAEVFTADLRDPSSLAHLPRTWEGVIHLAGATVPSLFRQPAPVVLNLEITLNLLDHLRDSKVVIVSSCHVYAPSGERRREAGPIRPQGLYGLSKHLVEQAGLHYRNSLDIRIARPFNHLGPGLRPELMVPSLLKRLAALDPAGDEPVTMEGLNSVRDFIDVRDVAEAYAAILALPRSEEMIFNVCTGRGTAIEEVVATALELLDRPRPVEFKGRPNSTDDIPFLVGDPERLHSLAGWTATRTLQESLASMLNIHRS